MRTLVLLAVLTLVGAASAHAAFVSASPAQDATVNETPTEVILTFSEPVEVDFGVFKVYPLGTQVNLSEDDAQLRINGLAGQLVSDVVEAQGDEDARADTGSASVGDNANDIVLPLKSDLAPGVYVVMWRVISADTHTVEGFYTFTYTPAG